MATNGEDIIHEVDSENSESDDTSLGSKEDKIPTEEEIKEFNEEVKTMQKEIKIVCGGPTGVGKSTLLNGLMGYSDEPEESSVSCFNVQDSLDRGTLGVVSKPLTKNEIKITLFDTPGLEGCNDADDAYLKEIKEKCDDFDLFLYCINSTESRATELFDEKSSLVKFTRLFGVELWNNAVIVLTQANALEANLEEDREVDPEIDVKAAFQEKITDWRQRIRKELQNMGVRKKKVMKIPILPAGTAVSPDLPGHSFWLSQIFEKVTDRMKYKAKMAYLQFSSDRLQLKHTANIAVIASQKIGDQPFVVSRKFKVLAALTSTGAGMAGAVTGAGIGATVGALAFGIPTFGLLAVVGLGVGGLIGAAVGSGSGLASAMAFRYFKKKRLARKKKKEQSEQQENIQLQEVHEQQQQEVPEQQQPEVPEQQQQEVPEQQEQEIPEQQQQEVPQQQQQEVPEQQEQEVREQQQQEVPEQQEQEVPEQQEQEVPEQQQQDVPEQQEKPE